MNSNRSQRTRRWMLLTLSLGLLWSLGCGPKADKSAKSTHPAPTQTTRPVSETDLNVIELTEDAIRRLNLQTVAVEARKMVRTRPYGADLVLPTDASVIVSAPLAGTLRSPSDRLKLEVGRRVDRSQPILSIYPLLSPERSVLTPAERIRFAEAKNTLAQSKIDAEGAVQQASVQVDAAKIALDRAQRLLQDMVGTVRNVDEAQAQLDLALKNLAAVKQRQTQIEGVVLDEEAGTLASIPIPTPISGILRTVQVQPGEMVAAGAPLFEVMDDQILWVQTPVYVGDLAEIDTTKPARVTMLDGRPSEQDVMVKPIDSPPTASPLAAAVDLYFELPNPDHRFQPGQKIALHLPLQGDEVQTAIPWESVIHDIYGGQWVYEQTGERQFVRRRVQVGWVDGDWAAIRHGPAVGAKVVTAGAAELAGAEFGFAK